MNIDMDTIAFFEIEEWEKEYISQSFTDKKLFFTTEKVQDEENQDFFQASVVSPFIYSSLNKEFIDKFPNLKLIATRSTGYDHIDLNYCKEKGITVVNVPSYGAHTVAEHTMGLILLISRNLIRTIQQSRRGNYELKELTGFDLAGKTIGIIGAGKIGDKVMKLSLAFEMNVLLYTRHPEDVEGIPHVKAVSLDELLSDSDIVTLHLPHTPETHHIINKENIEKFKKGSILINTARGPLIETQALLDGLETGILKAVGLDVLEEEGGLKEERELLTDEYFKKTDIRTQLMDHMLLDREDVYYTSHNAFNSVESVHQILDINNTNIKAYLEGKPENTVESETH